MRITRPLRPDPAPRKTEDIRSFEATPTYILDFLNAHEEGDEVVMAGYFQEIPTPAPLENADGYGYLMAYVDEHSFRSQCTAGASIRPTHDEGRTPE